jgi:arylsulfatase
MPVPTTRWSRRDFVRQAALASGALAACGERGSGGRPNLLVLVSDQQHSQALGCVDPWFETRHLDALAAEGVRFEHAFCTTPQCSPSRSSLMTGNYPSRTGVLGNIGALGGEPLRQPTIGAALQREGYTTGYFGKWHLGGDPAANAGWAEEWRENQDAEVTRRGIRFLREHAAGPKPFALFLHWLDPHDIYDFLRDRPAGAQASAPLPRSWREETFAAKPAIHIQFMIEDQGRIIHDQPQAVWEWYRAFYRGKVKLLDDHVGEVLAALRESGAWDRTVIAFTSDHGDMDTHHRLIFKGPFLYEHMVRIPSIFRVPEALGGRNGRRLSAHHTVNTDIAPTLLDLAGVPLPGCDGVSLAPLLRGGDARPREYVIGQYYGKQRWVNPIRMIRTPEFKYNRYIQHGEELYDLRSDPEELVNLAADPGYQGRKAELAAELARWMAGHRDSFASQQATDRQGNPLGGAAPSSG